MTNPPSNVDPATGEITKPRITFAETLATFNGGALNDELSAALNDVVEAVLLQDKAGTLTLKLSISADGGGVIVQADVNGNPPRAKKAAFFYHDAKRQGLSRRDPRQPQMPGMEDED